MMCSKVSIFFLHFFILQQQTINTFKTLTNKNIRFILKDQTGKLILTDSSLTREVVGGGVAKRRCLSFLSTLTKENPPVSPEEKSRGHSRSQTNKQTTN